MDGKEAAFGSPAPATSEPEAVTPQPNKALNFGLNGAGDTPATPVLPSSVDDAVDYNLFIKETLLWSNKIRSTFYFIAGFLAWLVVRAICLSPTTLPTGICYVLLTSLFSHFLLAVMAPKAAEHVKYSGSSCARFASTVATSTVDVFAAIHDKHLSGHDPLRTLQVGLGLWLLSLLGRAVDGVTLLLLLHVAAFSLPLAYSRFKTQIDTQLSNVNAAVKTHYENAPRKFKAPAILALLALLVWALPSFDRLVAFCMILVYGRAILKPNEYASLAKRVEPMTARVAAVGNTATQKLVGVANKYELTPTPLKKRR